MGVFQNMLMGGWMVVIVIVLDLTMFPFASQRMFFALYGVLCLEGRRAPPWVVSSI